MVKPPPKILVVDDDLATCQLIQRFLMTQDYQTAVAADGRAALALFAEFSPTLVILDVNLPDASGYNLGQAMQSQAEVLILLLTSRTDEADKVRGFIQGADDYLTKPFSLTELGDRIKALLSPSAIGEDSA
jgi:two-component system, OmpR family, response regulator